MGIIKNKKQGTLIIVSGPSGAGKDSICNKVAYDLKNVWISISYTSRGIRPGEVEGINYYYVSRDEFINKINNDDFLEYALYGSNYYGTPIDKIEEKLSDGKDVILVIEVEGAKKVKKLYPDAIFIFIVPPTMKELKKRLIERNTESKDKVYDRLKNAYNEINEITKYNYVVVNDALNDAVDKVKAIILSEKCRVDRIEEVFLDNKEEIIHESLIDKEFIN